MIDQLKLFRGEGYKINDKILIRQPTLEEIVDFGEQRYFGLVRTICSTPADRKVEIWDKLHVFWEKIDEYDLSYPFFRRFKNLRCLSFLGIWISRPLSSVHKQVSQTLY